MSRLVIIVTLFTIAFLFTQCKDDECPMCGCGGGGIAGEITGMTNFQSEFTGNSYLPNLILRADYTIVGLTPKFQFIPSAIACQPFVEIYDFGNWVDSIHVNSSPVYNANSLESQLLITNSSWQEFTLDDFNKYEQRDFTIEGYYENTIQLTGKPTQSDSFTFSFYYYKDGAIIDSSFTQKYYISNE